MLKLTSPNLPTFSPLSFQAAPTLTIFKGSPRSLPPAFRFTKSPLGDNPDELQSSDLGYPDFSGYLFQLTPGFTIDSVQNLYTSTFEFGQVVSPFDAQSVNYWVYQNSVYLYAERLAAPPGFAMTMTAIAQTNLPGPVSNNYAIDVSAWGGFTPTSVYTSGVYFNPAANPSSPQPGEFKLDSGVLTLYGSAAIAPAAFSSVQVTLSKTFTDPTPYLSVATFDLTEEQVFFVDGVDYLGLSFAPTINAYSPALNQYFWQSPYLTVFTDTRSLLPAKRSLSITRPPGGQSVSTITYNRQT